MSEQAAEERGALSPPSQPLQSHRAAIQPMTGASVMPITNDQSRTSKHTTMTNERKTVAGLETGTARSHRSGEAIHR